MGEAAGAGFSVAIHAIGDAAVRTALDAIERHREALAALPLPARIEHVQLLHPDDLGRFARLGVAASMQPQHATTDAPTARRAWGARCALAYPWGALLASGARLAFGSDAPVEPPTARLGLAAAVGRMGADGVPFSPGRRFADEALASYGVAHPSRARAGARPAEPGAPADSCCGITRLSRRGDRSGGPARLRSGRNRV